MAMLARYIANKVINIATDDWRDKNLMFQNKLFNSYYEIRLNFIFFIIFTIY